MKKIIITLITCIPILSFCQNEINWTCSVNKKIIKASSTIQIETIQLAGKYSSKSKVSIQFNLNEKDEYNRSIIIMSKQKNELLRQDLTDTTLNINLPSKYLIKNSRQIKNLYFYIVTLPKDPEKAALVRVAPQEFAVLKL